MIVRIQGSIARAGNWFRPLVLRWVCGISVTQVDKKDEVQTIKYSFDILPFFLEFILVHLKSSLCSDLKHRPRRIDSSSARGGAFF